MATIDDIINGSFGAIRGMSPDYRNQLNNWMVGNALKDAVPQRFALDGAGQIVQPIGNPALTPSVDAPIPQMRSSMLSMFPDSGGMANPAVAAATSAGNPVTNVTGKMQPRSGGGLFDLLFGPSKNGMGGLAGLLGGPGAGGLMGQMASSSGAREPYKAPRKDPVYGVSATGQRTGYGASPGQKTAGLKPGDRVYNADSNSWELK